MLIPDLIRSYGSLNCCGLQEWQQKRFAKCCAVQ